ncbi:MAG: BamA/TamA family outer membrane protein [Prevotellaceae bacterium]|jgi:outer membrane protein assembly factor BamA|nr:BamA/TamA family outer membrane protein [Prevotellaceae bacterium]
MICPYIRAGAFATLLAASTATTSMATPLSYSDSIAMQAYAYSAAIVKRIDVADSQRAWLRKAGVNLKKFEGKPADKVFMSGVLQKFIRYSESNGYPFARAQLDNVRIDSGYFYATLTLSQGNRITIDSLIVKGDGRVRASFMQNHLGLRKPRLYSEPYVKDVDRRINELGFVGTAQPSAVEFRRQSSTLYTYLSTGKANRASGLLAFNSDENDKLQMNGEASIFVANMFRGGEELGLEWSSPEKNTQLLHVFTSVPYLVLGAMGISAQLNMERRDTLYTNLNGRLGLSMPVGWHGKSSLFVELQRHNNSSSLQSTTVNLTLYGVDLLLRRTDNPLFPRSGYSASLSFAVGRRSVSASSGSAASTSMESAVEATWHFLSSRRTSILARVQGKMKGAFAGAGSEKLLPSELYGIGGAGSLRGFNERSVFTPCYAIATVEPQLFYSAQGYLHAFYDYAAMDNSNTPRGGAVSQLHSFGAGTRFATGAGIFSITCALGGEAGKKLLLKNAKVHVAYTAVF